LRWQSIASVSGHTSTATAARRLASLRTDMNYLDPRAIVVREADMIEYRAVVQIAQLRREREFREALARMGIRPRQVRLIP